MNNELSAYVLTLNAARDLEEILTALSSVTDDIVVLDSGSNDATQEIAERHHCRFIYRAFDNFPAQRSFAASQCKHDWILTLDADEIPNQAFLEGIHNLKITGFQSDAYSIERHWEALGRKVHACYPIQSPDHPIRLYNKQRVGFSENCNQVHECLSGYQSLSLLKGEVLHKTFVDKAELNRKLEQYTDLAANDVIREGRWCSWPAGPLHAVAAFLKFYISRQNWRDGVVGLELAKYAARYTNQKYQRAAKR